MSFLAGTIGITFYTSYLTITFDVGTLPLIFKPPKLKEHHYIDINFPLRHDFTQEFAITIYENSPQSLSRIWTDLNFFAISVSVSAADIFPGTHLVRVADCIFVVLLTSIPCRSLNLTSLSVYQILTTLPNIN